jgi:hypothetical protein
MHLAEVSPEDVFSGRVLRLVKRWTRPIAARIHESASEASKDIARRTEDLGRKMGEEVWRKGQRDGAGAPIVAKKFITPTVNQMRLRAGELDQSECLLPPAPPGGWDKHLSKDEGDADDLGKVSLK